MGNYYHVFCADCKEYLFLGKSMEFWRDTKKMYILHDFLMSHAGHNIGFSGDEWNLDSRFIKLDGGILDGYTAFDEKYSKLDYYEEYGIDMEEKDE